MEYIEVYHNRKIHVRSTCASYKGKKNYDIFYITYDTFYAYDDSLVCQKCKRHLDKLLKKKYDTATTMF